MIELGKKYKANNTFNSKTTYTCVYVGKTMYTLEAENGRSLLVPHDCSWIIEHKEPVVHTRHVIWYQHHTKDFDIGCMINKTYKDEIEARDLFSKAYPHHRILKIAKLTYTEE